MSKKYLIISIVTLIVITSGTALYYLLGVEEETGVIPPPNPVAQNVETNTGVGKVGSGEEDTNSGYIDFAVGSRILKSEAQVKLIDEFTDDFGTKYRAYFNRITMQKLKSDETELYHLQGDYDYMDENDNGIIWLSPDGKTLLFKYISGSFPSLNGINIDSKELLWNGTSYGTLIWSPDRKNLAIIGQSYETLDIELSRNDNIRYLENIVSTQITENGIYYWESNDTFVYNPNMTAEEKKYYDEYVGNNPQYTKINPGMNRFSVRNSNSVSFSPSEISEILSKIDENTKKHEEEKKNTTGISEENYLVNYTPHKSIPGGEVRVNIAGSGQVFTVGENILYFDGFSPSKYYLIYTSEKLNDITSKYLRDLTTGETIEFYECSIGIWTIDKKRYICNNSRGGMTVSKYGDLLQTNTVQEEMIFSDLYTDDRYIYGIGHNKFSLKEYRYLKIFDLTTLKEVYSQEIK